ncbi:MAG: YciI family protein [Telluria sp.]
MVKLIPPRPTFHLDANDRERELMRGHAMYWREHIACGLVVAFGPVLGPDGAFGVGLLRAMDGEEISAFLGGDPALSGGIGLVAETYPMASLICAP